MAQHALLMVKNIDSFPEDNGRMTGVIDIWWIISILDLDIKLIANYISLLHTLLISAFYS